MRNHHLFHVRGFAPVNQGGHLLLETWHDSVPSKDMEVAAWRTRMRRGEVGRIEVDDHEYPQRSEVIYSTDQRLPSPGVTSE